MGVVVNLAATWVLASANRTSLNVEGSFQHILTDLYAFIATAIAGAVVLWTGWVRADALASLLVAALMLRAAYGLLRDSGRIFLEAAPSDLDPDEIGRALVAQSCVTEVHDLHVWEISSGFPALTAHVLVSPDCDCHATRRRLAEVLDERFGIGHTTLQVDHAQPPQTPRSQIARGTRLRRGPHEPDSGLRRRSGARRSSSRRRPSAARGPAPPASPRRPARTRA